MYVYLQKTNKSRLIEGLNFPSVSMYSITVFFLNLTIERDLIKPFHLLVIKRYFVHSLKFNATHETYKT